jgi:circadian clock protein KaiB
MPKSKKPTKNKKNKKTISPKYVLTLYMVGQTPHCLNALKNLRKICDENSPESYKIDVIDLLQLPELAKEDQILAIPTVIRKSPKPSKKLIGDLSNKEEVLNILGFPPKE